MSWLSAQSEQVAVYDFSEKRDATDAYQYVNVMHHQPLGSGGFGCVYKAFDVVGGRHVAVKETSIGRGNEALVEALESEFVTLVSLSHPHIVKVHRLAFQGGVAQIFMEWMSGGSVLDLMKQQGHRLHEKVVRRYTREALEGLSYLHSQGLLHRDLKPANMLVDGNGSVKLSDFGTCRAAVDSSATTTQHIVGTCAYMSPEAIVRGKYSASSDVWAIGCSIVEMATGRMPWWHLPAEQLAPVSLMFHIGTAVPPDHHPLVPAHLSADLRAILDTCFTYNPADRPTAASLLALSYFTADDVPKDAETLDAFEDSIEVDRLHSSSSDATLTRSLMAHADGPSLTVSSKLQSQKSE